MSYQSEMELYWGEDVMEVVSNPRNPDASGTNAAKVTQVLKIVIGEFYREAGVTVTEDDITSTNLYLGPALARGLFHLQVSGGKIGPPQDDKSTLEAIRLVTHSDRLVPQVGDFEEDEGVFAREEDGYFPDSLLKRYGFPDKPEPRE